ncbi:MAG: hypothetical protein Q9218_003925 [Villophora microphyllina]
MTADIMTTYTLDHSYELLSKPTESRDFLRTFAFTFRLLKVQVRLLNNPDIVKNRIREIDKKLRGFHKDDTQVITAFSAITPTYIKSSLPFQERTGQPLHDVTIMLLAAGFETTGFALTIATYYVLTNPSILLRLQQELRSNIPSTPDILPWQDRSKLPYLSAIIKESLRLSLGATARLPRVNREKDMVFGEWIIPKGAAISMSHSDLHYDESVFPEPLTFKPERWLLGEESKRSERYLVPFSRGARRCMGLHLAEAELYLTRATVFRNYDLQLYKKNLQDVAPARDFFVPAPEPGGIRLGVVVTKKQDVIVDGIEKIAGKATGCSLRAP